MPNLFQHLSNIHASDLALPGLNSQTNFPGIFARHVLVTLNKPITQSCQKQQPLRYTFAN